jgi:hypothetical protein
MLSCKSFSSRLVELKLQRRLSESEELYFFYLLHKQGKVNLNDFWNKLFATDGIFDIKLFLPKEPKQPGPPAKS